MVDPFADCATVGGLLTNETVYGGSGNVGNTATGTATFTYDLAGRLKSWISPYKYDQTTGSPTTKYGVDDGGNVTPATVTALPDGSPTGTPPNIYVQTTSTYDPNERPVTRSAKVYNASGSLLSNLQDQFSYTALGSLWLLGHSLQG